jgi:hypothetical protein
MGIKYFYIAQRVANIKMKMAPKIHFTKKWPPIAVLGTPDGW